jgi:pimeloyl-ACP methyl ester carboxylesterase
MSAAADPETVETALGPVEVARAGDGPPVLMIHGTPGGWDSSLAMGGFLAAGGCELIAPARPGYQGTSLDGREAIDDQADLHAALLDALGHRRAGVLTWSGGGPSGYRLAVRQPDRVAGLVAAAAVSQSYEPLDEDLETRLMLKTTPGNWVLRTLAAHAPKTTISATLGAEGDLSREELKALTAEAFADERERDVVLTMAGVVGDYAGRRTGIDNDWAQFGAIDSLELERIVAPTLIVNGDADSDVPPAHSDFAAATIPGAERVVMERGTHLCLWVHPEAEATQTRAIEVLRANQADG